MDQQAGAWEGFSGPVGNGHGPEIRGDVIFACYRDATFAERLCDTGWQSFSARWILGGSLASLEFQDNELIDWIGKERLQVDMWPSVEGVSISISGESLALRVTPWAKVNSRQPVKPL
jgi:hypothetical protein